MGVRRGRRETGLRNTIVVRSGFETVDFDDLKFYVWAPVFFLKLI